MSENICGKGWTACKGRVLDEAGCPAFMPDVGDEMLAEAITEAHNFRVSRLGEELAKARKERDDVIASTFQGHQQPCTFGPLCPYCEIERLTAWVNDLQSGMYVNCVYCGHRYGPKETTPVTMADALKAHVEQCPKHPMSTVKADRDKAIEGLQRLDDLLSFGPALFANIGEAGRNEITLRCAYARKVLQSLEEIKRIDAADAALSLIDGGTKE